MAELIHQYSKPASGGNGGAYIARLYGHQRADRMWEAWLEFVPINGARRTLRTDQETEQANRDALTYWAAGVESSYLDGALTRAHPREEE